MHLTAEHIDYITKDLHYRGIVLDNIHHELLDHICAGTEEKMKSGMRFIDAYHQTLKAFGHTAGLRQTQHQVLISENTKNKFMFRNYLTIALRNLRKHSFYSFINVAGLSIGISICMVILLFILHELKYDKHHEKGDRIYRIHTDIKFGGNHFDMVFAPAPLASLLVEEFPEVEAAVHFRSRGSYLVKRDTENIKENNVIWAGKDFFKIFTVPLLAGNPDLALVEPNSIAISKTIADKFFPNENALDQTLTLDNRWPMKITAVFEDMPATSHFHFDILIAAIGLKEAQSSNLLSNNFQTYLLLREGSRAEALNEKLPSFIAKHTLPQAVEVFGADFTMEKFEESGNHIRYTLQPLHDIHLKSNLMGEFEPNFDIKYIYMFASIALFILLIACINFMNLSTARSANRAKEVGVRKVMGSFRSHLMRQFLTESVLLSLFSFGLAIVFAYALLPVFNVIADRSLGIPFTAPLFYAIVGSAALLIGLLAGVYPAFFLSAFKPVNVLKGNVALGMKSGFIRSSLVVMQFTISIVLVIGTIVVYQQLNFIQNKKLGFNKDQALMIDDAYALGKNKEFFKNELLKNSVIQHATISGFLPVQGTWRSDTPWWAEGKDAVQENMVSLQNWQVDYDYIKTLGMTIKAGRDFSRDFPSDSSAVILNEAAAVAFNFPSDIIGSNIVTFAGDGYSFGNVNAVETLNVIGIVENFHFESLKQNVGPVMLFLSKHSDGFITFRFKAEDTKTVIALAESKWKELAPGQPFNYSFLDQRFGEMYKAEMRLGKIVTIFAVLAIVVASLGLFALTAFTAEQRTKEIGIRKVLGASVSSIVVLLSKEFGRLVIIAFVLASPLAWWFVSTWLEDYQYKIHVGWTIFALAGGVAFMIAILTMSFQSIKAAMSNPVKSLRSE